MSAVFTGAALLFPPGQEPTPPANPEGLSMAIWANLPLLVCLVFGVVIIIGLVVIVWKNQQVAREKAAWELAQKEDSEL